MKKYEARTLEDSLRNLSEQYGEEFHRRLDGTNVVANLSVPGAGFISYRMLVNSAALSFTATWMAPTLAQTEYLISLAYDEIAQEQGMTAEQKSKLVDMINNWNSSVKSGLVPDDLSKCPPETEQALEFLYLSAKRYGELVKDRKNYPSVVPYMTTGQRRPAIRTRLRE